MLAFTPKAPYGIELGDPFFSVYSFLVAACLQQPLRQPLGTSAQAAGIPGMEGLMIKTPIDAHCHLFNAAYIVEEAAAMGWAYVTGDYPHTGRIMKAAPAAGPAFSWGRLLETVRWFLDLRAAANSYEANYHSITEAYRDGLKLPVEEGLLVAPLMMDIFYMFSPPSSLPVPEILTERPLRARKAPGSAAAREASEADFDQFRRQVIAMAKAGHMAGEGGHPVPTVGATKNQEAASLSVAEIEQIFRKTKGLAARKAMREGLSAGLELSRGFRNQIKSLIELQKKYAGAVFPFLAVDPRRQGVVEMALHGITGLNRGRPLLSPTGPMFGVKLYTRLGYLPADVPDALYRHCTENRLPVVVHTSTGGFPPGSRWECQGHADPRHWDAVLERHPDLRLDFAHFGSGAPDWIRQIIARMNRYPNVYSDLACFADRRALIQARRLWRENAIVRDRLFFGTDFVVSSLTKILSLKGYFETFAAVFGPADLEKLMAVNTRKFLQPILPKKIGTANQPFLDSSLAKE